MYKILLLTRTDLLLRHQNISIEDLEKQHFDSVKINDEWRKADLIVFHDRIHNRVFKTRYDHLETNFYQQIQNLIERDEKSSVRYQLFERYKKLGYVGKMSSTSVLYEYQQYVAELSQIQSWIREKYQVHIMIIPIYHQGELAYNSIILQDEEHGESNYDPEWFNDTEDIKYSYEEALEFQLLEALEIIKERENGIYISDLR